MYKPVSNLYKQPHTFKCLHDAHRHFKSEMSPYYILIEKKCFPHGCLYFQWNCKLLAKHKKCFRNFTKVGRKCFNCSYFHEEKIHQYPEFLLDNKQQTEFVESFEEFNEWVESLRKKRVLCEGIVSSVKPNFILQNKGNYLSLNSHGFLVSFNEGYIDNRHFQGRFYLSLSSLTQNKLLISEGDELEFEANLEIDRGRFKFVKSGRFEFYKRGNGPAIKKEDVLVSMKTYTIQDGQPQKCLGCSYGILADIRSSEAGPGRAVICTQGVADYKICTVQVLDKMKDQQDECVSSKCNHVIK